MTNMHDSIIMTPLADSAVERFPLGGMVLRSGRKLPAPTGPVVAHKAAVVAVPEGGASSGSSSDQMVCTRVVVISSRLVNLPFVAGSAGDDVVVVAECVRPFLCIFFDQALAMGFLLDGVHTWERFFLRVSACVSDLLAVCLGRSSLPLHVVFSHVLCSQYNGVCLHSSAIISSFHAVVLSRRLCGARDRAL